MLPLEKGGRASNTSRLTDSFGRQISYLRLGLTNRCNLRCRYCMPEDGIALLPNNQLLSYEEIFRLLDIFVKLGVNKIRLTGGEPFVRRGAMNFLHQLLSEKRFPQVHITSNGSYLKAYLAELHSLGLTGINLSLDTLNPKTFLKITRRDTFMETWQAFEMAMELGVPIKLNMVVMAGINDKEIKDFAQLTEKYPIDVRFIEQMPFNGAGRKTDFYSANEITTQLSKYFPSVTPVSTLSRVANMYKIPGFQGQVGVIAAYSRTFCGSCNRIRLTPYGAIQTCLYGSPLLNLRDLIRDGASNAELLYAIRNAVNRKPQDGFVAEAENSLLTHPSMATIGG